MSVDVVPVSSSTVVVAIDVGKNEFAVSVTDAARRRLLEPRRGCPMTAPSVREVVARITGLLSAGAVVKVGIEAAGHYHLPLLAPPVWPSGWQLLELNPAQVTEQRRVLVRRTIKTDVIDLEAMTELLLAGRGCPVTAGTAATSVLVELTAWSAHRTRRVQVRSGLKNQLLGQLDRSFPGLTRALPDVLGTRIGRLVAAEFADPTRLAGLGSARLIRFGATRGLRISKPLADKLVGVARDALPMPEAGIARQLLAADLALLGELDGRVGQAETQLARLLPDSPFRTLTSVPGWGVVRAGTYAGALGDPTRFASPRQIYRSAGLNPVQYESAGKRRDSVISREGSVELRRALLGLGMGLWLNDPAAAARAAQLRARGKHGGVIACALAHRANRIAFALVRDQAGYDPGRWT